MDMVTSISKEDIKASPKVPRIQIIGGNDG